MHAVRQSVRPKHQVLILKCYPRFQKGVSDVKPNPSELSYLLYYASTRRSKVQKVGAFLEKKSGSDVSRGRVGNVQVTLHIIRALIDKSPRDLPLYAPYVLRILNLILRSKNLPMVEDSVFPFQAFCEHHDAAMLTADQEISKEFEDLLRGYAALVDKPPSTSRAPISKAVALKWRTAGLHAIKHVASSEAIGTSPTYLSIVIPVILQTLHSESDEWLLYVDKKNSDEKEIIRRRRLSTATAQTTESMPEDPAVSTTTAGADRQAEEEAGVLALESLRQAYSSSNRPQIRWATMALLKFVEEKPVGQRPDTAKTTNTTKTNHTGNWTTTLIELVAKEAPVQDRFIILITASGALAESPITEEDMKRQLVLALVIEKLLGSTINMIGLSVMDVLLTLIQHILLILQLGGKGTDILPHHQPTGAIDIFNPSESSGGDQTPTIQDVSTPSIVRQELLDRLRKCIGNLATHVYYSDQIRDIISAILLRLKPLSSTGLAGTAAAIERPGEAAQSIAQSVKMDEDESTDEFFSFGTARVAALNAVRDVMVVANDKGINTGAGAVGRSRVSVKVWEGTQWLLRDEDKRVRRAYIEALLTWLKLEMSKHDLRVLEETPKSKKSKAANTDDETTGRDALRSLSSSSPSTRRRMSKSAFLQLLHLAIYDNALEAPEEDSNILMMHLLLTSLVQKLGVNAAKSGLPMIVRLQEDINTTPEINTPKAKVNIGSLVHGYLWALSDVFEFDTTMAGFEIQTEILRRQKSGLWLDAVKVPPQPLELIVAHGVSAPESLTPKTASNETLKPFDHISSMVTQIAMAYSEALSSPPGSPPLSPGRVFAMPLVSASNQPRSADELPSEFKEAMTGKWSKESCLAAAEKSMARTVSPHGSRSGTTRSATNGLLSAEGHTPRDNSPGSGVPQSRVRGRIPSAFMPLETSQLKKPNNDSGPNTPVSDHSNHTGTLRVDDLKRVLAGGALADAFSNQGGRASVRTSSPLRNSQTATTDFAPDPERLGRTNTRPSVISATSDSIVDAEGFESASEGDIDHPLPSPQTPADSSEIAQQYMTQLGRRPYDPSPNRNSAGSEKLRDSTQPPRTPTSPSRRSVTSRPRSASETSTEDPEANARALRGGLPSEVVRGTIVADEGVPPVPPLPEGLIKRSNLASTNGNSGAAAQNTAAPSSAVLTLPPEVSAADFPAVSLENRPRSVGGPESLGDGSARGSLRGSCPGSMGRKSSGRAGAEKRNTVQALLGSIEVGDVGGKGIGRPPY
ncbi:MAG: plasma membrane localization protein [Stictis urceolatum]|nr:plasma membrane localization protein [Stictis urceolata]